MENDLSPEKALPGTDASGIEFRVSDGELMKNSDYMKNLPVASLCQQYFLKTIFRQKRHFQEQTPLVLNSECPMASP
jgi:hypothetical protein